MAEEFISNALFDLNELPTEASMEEVFAKSGAIVVASGEYPLADRVDIEDYEDEKSTKNVFEPFVGQCFLSEEEAFIFYKNYANRHGFSIRKGRFVTKNGEIVRRDFFCHREGRQPLKIVNHSLEQRNRESSRCGCKAHLRITLRNSFDIFPKEWHVTTFVVDHNHELLSPLQVRFLPAKRVINKDDEKCILLLKEAGLSIRQIMRVMELEKNVKHGHLPFLHRDIRNFYVKMRRMHEVNDAMGLLQYCKVSKEENSQFQYAFTMDEEGKLEHVFWSPTPCFDWYQKYGDVVVFDTTYKVNAYDMPFGIFVGVNNHGKTVLFGCALLRNETTNAFRWLMKTFTCLMKKPPKTILTDQDPWMTEAISKELPLTKHAFCIWHITAKFSGWFTATLQNQYSNWCMDFYKLYKLDSCADFEHQWFQVISKYDMIMNKHVNGLHQIKHFWAPCYLRGYFFGGMTTTGRSESINAFIKRFVTAHISLVEFAKQIDLSIEDVEQTQSHDTMLETYRGSCLRTLSPLEEQAHSILTPYAFKLFQEEFGRATQYSVLKEKGGEFVLQYYKDKSSQMHKVSWDGKMATCTCKHFEFWGILCRHVLSVFLHKDCYHIPPVFLSPRWCREAIFSEKEMPLLDHPNLTDMENEIEENHNDDNDSDCFVNCPPISKTKGRPKQKRMKGGRELGKQTRTCGLCKRVGHYITTCPEKENAAFSNGANKRKKTTSTTEELNPVFCLKY